MPVLGKVFQNEQPMLFRVSNFRAYKKALSLLNPSGNRNLYSQPQPAFSAPFLKRFRLPFQLFQALPEIWR